MLTMRPLPATPYREPVCAPHRLLPVAPPASIMASLPINTSLPIGAPNLVPKRRPHTRRLQSPSPDLPPVTEEEETETQDAEQSLPPAMPKKKSRPTPLVTSRTYAPSSSLPLLVEIPNNSDASEQPMKDEHESLALSPSMLLTRRRSETVLDFPLPPSHALPTPPLEAADNSPTPSNVSLSTTSSSPTSPFPLTPNQSEVDENERQPHPAKAETEAESWADFRFARHPYRSASVVSLRSFSLDKIDPFPESKLRPRHEVPRRSARVLPAKHVAAPAPTPRSRQSPRSPRLVLSVLDTARGGSFDVPLVLGSFLSLPESPAKFESFWADSDNDSDGEGIPTSWSDVEEDDLGSALSSSEEEASDSENGPKDCFDPAFREKLRCRRRSRAASKSPVSPPRTPAPEDPVPETPSEYSVGSPVEWRTSPLEFIVPSDLLSAPSPSPVSSPLRAPSPFFPPREESPVLRSRFSSSTLGSLPPEPTSSTQAFFTRLAGRVKGSSPTKSERSSTSHTSVRRRPIPPSPMPSTFSFSTSSRSSLDSADDSSLLSDDSGSSTGLRRPPIPIELFLRG